MMQFNIKSDNQLINEGSHFWCNSCLTARPIDDRSPDPRYCLFCYDFLKIEAGLLSHTKRPAWVPRKFKSSAKSLSRVPGDAGGNMSTLNVKKTTVDIIPSVTPINRRGPKSKNLPDDLIKQLAAEGMGAKSIASRLKAEGHSVSYKTVQRRLQGVLLT